MKSNESGRSMVEMIGVMAIMGLITAAGFVMVRTGMQSQKRSRTVDEIELLAANARNITAGSEYTCTLPNLFIPDGQNLAKSILKTSGESPVGGFYSLLRSTTDSTSYCEKYYKDKRFLVYVVGISEEDCAALASYTYQNGTAKCVNNNVLYYLSVTYNK